MILCCLHLGGGNYGLLQALAWTKMLVNYSMQDGLIQGTAKTFDGQHPCSMCKQIVTAKKKDSERPQDQQLAARELLLKNFIAAEITTAKMPVTYETLIVHSVQAVIWNTLGEARPPVPPPRALA